jgi:hypothetical protein
MNVVSFAPPSAPLELWLEYCAARGLTPDILAPMKGELLTLDKAAKVMGTGIFGFKQIGAVGAFVFQLADNEYQARILYGPPPEVAAVGATAKRVKQVKYFRPKHSANYLYVPPHLTDWHSTSYNLLIVEGALNAVRLAAQGFHAVAITGVYNYRIGSKSTPIIPELVKFAQSPLVERMTIMFDSDTGDAEDNRALWNGFHNLAQDLMRLRGNRRDSIFSCRPPSKVTGEKNGPDDYLHTAGLDEFNKLLREQSERYADNPYLILERTAQERYIYEDDTGLFFDVENRATYQPPHIDRSLATYGKVDDILAQKPTQVLYNHQRLLSAPGTRIARGRRLQPDTDAIYFHDDDENKNYINLWQPEDVPKPIKGDVDVAYRMMRSICRNTPGAVQKLLIIAAMHAQNPTLTPKYGLLMTGQQGSGKSTLARLIGLSLSNKYHSDRVNLSITFNRDWRGFACKEWPEFDKSMDEEWLKDLITCKSYSVSEKYRNSTMERNHTLNIFTCNGLQAKLQEGDRRFLVCGEAKADNKVLGLEFEAWVNGMGPSHFRYHLLNDIDCSGYDLLDVWTEIKDAVIEASKSYRSTVCDYVIDELSEIEGLECVPNPVLSYLLEKHKVGVISFNKEFGQYFIKPAKETVKIDGQQHRFRAFKNHEKWRKEEGTEEYKKQYDLAMKILKR